MTSQPLQRERIVPSPVQVRQAKHLLHAVPAASYDWASDAGRAFLGYIVALADGGVPTAWLAHQLGLDPGRLYATLSRHRKAVNG